MTVVRLAAVAVLAALAVSQTGVAGPAWARAAADPLETAFAEAAAARDVPRDLLVAVAYAETHLDGHGGAPSASGGYGVMHLVGNPTTHTLERAAELTGEPVARLRADTAANVLGGAAVLRALADEQGLDAAARKDVARWYTTVAEYGNASTPEVARLYADTVYELLGTGFRAAGVTVAPREITVDRGPYARIQDLNARGSGFRAASADYPGAAWVAANSGNYTGANRESSHRIDRIVIHVTQGSYAGTISWFQNPSAKVSAHYVVRSSNGAVTQMVRDKDIAWHAGNWNYNTRSIGIEHEGFVSDASWFTDAMYRSSAALTRYLCDKYGIPKTRAAIIGHKEVPGADHTDPGSHWNWSRYMGFVTGGGNPSWSATVDNTTAGRFTASAAWGTSAYSGQRHGADYRFTAPARTSDPAWFRVKIPSAGTYRVDVWYPADPGYNSAAPYIVAASGGNKTVYVDQRAGGGTWRSIGTFSLAAGDRDVVGVSRWTSGAGQVIADAVRITRT
ncbi:N-acetylmuramoyl-L-alanine amidase [Spongiactinospora sp. TRM90649]|uniref:golvesin C-terminal-like domain-containing protein n=1 Tax=Spongiactinospora sp. TRM90649 TaxID=3031114 RepID=UPI0023F7D834|nr:N-acetylmuramoyl-L-alanine amidase [Spongiactinospora sp. TRM90649]MDF5753220.1 N-acetylmuramoyl-L-alanine amidase [Spongiactinospora sp. TRM90649]